MKKDVFQNPFFRPQKAPKSSLRHRRRARTGRPSWRAALWLPGSHIAPLVDQLDGREVGDLAQARMAAGRQRIRCQQNVTHRRAASTASNCAGVNWYSICLAATAGFSGFGSARDFGRRPPRRVSISSRR